GTAVAALGLRDHRRMAQPAAQYAEQRSRPTLRSDADGALLTGELLPPAGDAVFGVPAQLGHDVFDRRDFVPQVLAGRLAQPSIGVAAGVDRLLDDALDLAPVPARAVRLGPAVAVESPGRGLQAVLGVERLADGGHERRVVGILFEHAAAARGAADSHR